MISFHTTDVCADQGAFKPGTTLVIRYEPAWSKPLKRNQTLYLEMCTSVMHQTPAGVTSNTLWSEKQSLTAYEKQTPPTTNEEIAQC